MDWKQTDAMLAEISFRCAEASMTAATGRVQITTRSRLALLDTLHKLADELELVINASDPLFAGVGPGGEA